MHPTGIPRNQRQGMIAFAWFVWDQNHRGPPSLDWIEPKEQFRSANAWK